MIIFKFLIFIQLVIAIVNLTAANFFLKEGIIGLFLAILHGIIQHNLSYQFIIINMLIGLYYFMKFLLFFLQPFQNQVNIETLSSLQRYAIGQSIVCSIYYLFLAIFSFYPYIEFKSIAYHQNPVLK